MLVVCVATEAKTIKITLSDGTVKVFTSSQLSAIDFNDDGTLTITTYNGQVLPALEADFESVNINYDAVVSDIYPVQLSFNIDADGRLLQPGILRARQRCCCLPDDSGKVDS